MKLISYHKLSIKSAKLQIMSSFLHRKFLYTSNHLHNMNTYIYYSTTHINATNNTRITLLVLEPLPDDY